MPAPIRKFPAGHRLYREGGAFVLVDNSGEAVTVDTTKPIESNGARYLVRCTGGVSTVAGEDEAAYLAANVCPGLLVGGVLFVAPRGAK